MPTLAAKTQINQYRVEEFVAPTPLGEFYRVTDERSNKSFALILLPTTAAENAEALKKLEASSPRLQAISDPNLTKYLGLTKTANKTFLLEEWVDGPSLKDMRARGKPNAEEALFLAKGICGALEALHKQNFIHLHLAPELIRINQRGDTFFRERVVNRSPQTAD